MSGESTLNIFFDIDYTIIETDQGTIRPGVIEVFERLGADGHTVYIWSGMGARTEEVTALGLDHLVSGVFQKPWENYQRNVGRMVAEGEIPVPPDLVVDDTAAVVRAFGGILIGHYGSKSPPGDQWMERVYRIIGEYAVDGHSPDPAFTPVTRFGEDGLE